MTLRGMDVVDSHVHLLPGRLGEKVRAFFDAGIGTSTPLAYPNDHDAVVTSLHHEGVDEIWTLPYAHKPGVARGLNEAASATVQQFVDAPLSIVGGLTVHPGDDEAVSIVSDAVDKLGLRVLKLHCSVGSFLVTDARLRSVYACANERRLPVVVHLGHNVNGKTESNELPAIAEIADAFPEMPLILAHCGHHSAPVALRLMLEHPSLFADLTPVVREFPEVDAHHLQLLADRILFGSDAPNTAISVTKCLAWLSEMNLGDTAMTSILGANARRIIANVAA